MICRTPTRFCMSISAGAIPTTASRSCLTRKARSLRLLEETFGRERFDQFLKGYFERFAFQSITTDDFIAHLKKNLLDPNPQLAAKIQLEEWIYKPGLPASAPKPQSDAFAKVEA